jgi:salicylate hydroxylase
MIKKRVYPLLETVSTKQSLPQTMTVVGIVGGGIGGLTLALALQNLGIKSILFEKDYCFDARSQGYGLTLQQGGRALKVLGILPEIRSASCSSTSHFIFNQRGECVVFWGNLEGAKHAVWNANRNLHIGRQNLRRVLLDAIDTNWCTIHWVIGNSLS